MAEPAKAPPARDVRPPASKPAPPAPKVTPAPAPSAVPKPTPPVAPAGNGLAAREAAAGKREKPVVTKPDEVIDLQDGVGEFKPSEAMAEYIAQEPHGAEVDVKFGKLSSGGTIRVRKIGDAYAAAAQSIPLDHPFLAPLAPFGPVLAIKIGSQAKNQVTGFATLKEAMASHEAIDRHIHDNADAFGMLGFELPRVNFVNEVKGGKFTFGTKETVPFKLAGWLKAGLDLKLDNETVTFAARAHVAVKGLSEADLALLRDDKGNISGEVDVSIQFAKFSGTAKAKYLNGVVDVTGTVKYASEKFTGAITIIVADAAEADAVAKTHIPPESLLQGETATDAAQEGKAAKPKKGERGIAGWGELDFAFTDWLTGKAQVVVGPTGYITVIGKIAPPKSIELLHERPYNTQLFGTEIALRYGLPYVADIHVGINIALGATARIGPAVLTDMVIEGTYSTDPAVLNSFSIAGSFRISAYAGLTLTLEGKAGLTILKHDIDVGAGVKATAGVKGYAEARPQLGFREKADPVAGKKGEYYIKGHLEIAAQPFLGLDGYLFVRLDSPWWSPAPDKTWKWPIGSLEYPLPGEFGIGADVDYVIGSEQWPEIKWGKADFEASKFTDSLMDDKIPAKAKGGDAEKPAGWKGEEPQPPTAPPAGPRAGAPAPGKVGPGKGTPAPGAGKGGLALEEKPNVPGSPDISKRWLSGLQALAELHDRAEKDPEDEVELNVHLDTLKQKFGFASLTAHPDGDYWSIDAEMNPRTRHSNKKARVRRAKGKPKDETKRVVEDARKAAGGDPARLDQKILDQITQADKKVRRAVSRITGAFKKSSKHGGRAISTLGKTVEQMAGDVMVTTAGERADIGVAPQVGRGDMIRVLDYIVDVGNHLSVVEVKYQLPNKNGEQLTRLVAQMRAALSDPEWEGVILFTFKPPTPQALKLLVDELGAEAVSSIVIVHGFEHLAATLDEMIRS